MGRNCFDWCCMDNAVMIFRFIYPLIFFFISGYSVIAAASTTPQPVAALWPASGEYPVVSSAAAFSCSPSIRTPGDSRWEYFSQEAIGRVISERHWSGSYYYGWTDQGQLHDCYMYVKKPYCPKDYTWDGQDSCLPNLPDNCAANAGLFYNSGFPANVEAGINGDDPYIYVTSKSSYPNGATGCIDHCVVDITAGSKTVGFSADGGDWTYYVNPRFTGKKCGVSTPTPEPNVDAVPKTSPEYDCLKKGMSYGTVGNAVVCVAPLKPSEAKGKTETTTKSNPDGTKSETKTESSVKCDGDVCTTTTTTTTTIINADGSRGASSTTTETKSSSSGSSGSSGSGSGLEKSDSFCVENPSSPICKSGKFSGNCNVEPYCDGDAVQCATAKAVFQTKCSLQADTATLEAGKAVMMPGGDAEAKEAFKRSEVVVTTDTSNAGGGCVPDRTFSIGGKTFSIPFSQLCDGFAMMRVALLAIAGITAAFIVIGGIK